MPTAIHRSILIAILSLFISAGTISAQSSHMSSGDARITGHVRDAGSGDPLESVRVELSPMGGGIAMFYVVTGTDGEFGLSGMQDGSYDVVINEKGYMPYREAVTLANGNMVVLTIRLEKAAGDREAPAAALSAHELTMPQKARDAYAKGIAMKAKPDYAAALEQFQKASKLAPSYYEAFAEAGVAEVNLNKPEDAERDLNRSLELSDGKYPAALFYLAALQNNQRKFDEGLQTAQKGLALDANAWRGQFEMARALIGLKRADEALPYAKKAEEAAPGNSQMYILLMNANIGAHKYADAVGAIDTFLKLSATGPQADQVRRLREQVVAAMQKQQAEAAPAASSPAARTTSPAPH